jgi:hypothetical protein
MNWRVVLVTCVGCVAVALSSCSTSHARAAAPRSSTTTPAHLAIPTAEVTALRSALVSRKPSEVASVLALGIRSAYLKKPWEMLPVGSHITVTSVATVSGKIGTLPVTVTGSRPGRWLLLLVHENGQWLVYGTRPA